MLDRFVIFTKTGVILWSFDFFGTTSITPVAALVKNVLLPDRTDASSFDAQDGHSLKWLLDNSRDLVFTAVYSTSFAARMRYVDSLLASVREAFVREFGSAMASRGKQLIPAEEGPGSVQLAAQAGATVMAIEGEFQRFAKIFEALLNLAEQAQSSNASSKAGSDGASKSAAKGTAASTEAASAQQVDSEAPRTPVSSNSNNAATPTTAQPAADDADGDAANADGDGDGDADDPVSGRAALLAKAASRSKSGGYKAKLGKGKTSTPQSAPKVKESRQWDDFSYSAAKAASLQKAPAGGAGNAEDAYAGIERVQFSGTGQSRSGADLIDEDDSVDAAAAAAAASAAAAATAGGGGGGGWWSRSTLGSLLSTWTGSKVLEQADLDPVVEAMRQHLMAKNVSKDTADALCASLATQLVGTKLDGGATLSVQAAVQAAVQKALRASTERILTPGRPVDILRAVRAKREAQAGMTAGTREPFVIVMCGVNGVGKSTTLAKITYHLKDHGHNVLIAACDSFRAGAVEQLVRHCKALDTELFQQGYSKDPVQIAADAIRKAKQSDVDAVLVDTAGRMQNNQQLMLQLAKLVHVNRPDLVLFVGEALVGNDGVDQLVEFDRALKDLAADATHPRSVDGIVLTKFDTVDDKVGTALSMVYRTGIPIVFLGVGQQYPDLRKLNVAAVVKALLS